MVESCRKMISITEENYRALKRLGFAGDSFNDVLCILLKHENGNRKPLRSGARVDPSNHSIADTTIKATGDPQ